MPPTEPPRETPPETPGPGRPRPRSGWQRWQFLFWYLLLALWLLFLWQASFGRPHVRQIPYSQFKEYLAKGLVTEASIGQNEIRGVIELKKGTTQPTKEKLPEKFDFSTVRVEDPQLTKELDAAGVNYKGVLPSKIGEFIWAWIIPIALMVLLWFGLSRFLRGAGSQVMTIGKSRARIVPDRSTGVTFNDVAGADEAKAELKEVVDFLKQPQHYTIMGAQIPKGILLSGPPGTGKTLLARAVAGEAHVPFFSISGSDFVEMFVGVGAARVRDLFMQAKAKAPCIVFIDELDAIGRQRGFHVGAVNDEREQTLNQLLVEMDGFEANTGVIILSATNRPDVLDRALLRPGRFDRQVIVDAPDLNGREAILRVHARGKPLAPDVNLRRIAQATPGFSGADLANALNEAALLAVRSGHSKIMQPDLEEAVEKVVAGPERKSRRLNEAEKQRVAYHEVGHGIVAAYSRYTDPVHKISIVPRGRAALGYTLQVPTEDQFLMTREELTDRLTGLLGGRAAEEVVFKTISTGAQSDLERATAMARQMVCLYGMSDRLGLIQCAYRDGRFPGEEGLMQRDCSEETAREIDEEVRRILDEAHERAKALLTEHRDELERIANELLKHETIDRQTFESLLDPDKFAAMKREKSPHARPIPLPSHSGADAFSDAGSSPPAEPLPEPEDRRQQN
jgi:cell division protease FtsH